jgi:uncharacterized protein YutE (UPF0331/DUF86 family)
MVDQERVDRMLDRIASDVRRLAELRELGTGLIADHRALAAAKYYFITAIEGCVRVAHHLISDQEWKIADSNADAIRRLGAEEVLTVELAEALARAVGFRNILVHEYAEIDNLRVVANLDRLDDLTDFVAAVARWLTSAG